MILLWGTMRDDPMALVRAALAKAGADPIFLDHQTIFTSSIDCTFDDRGERCTVTAGDTALDMSAVTVAYVRGSNFYDYPEMRELPRDAPLAQQAASFEAQLIAWLDSSNAIVINRSGPSASNNSKPYQLAAIRNAGFRVPETFLTNDAEAARAFVAANPYVVYKSISGTRSIVRPLQERQRSFLDDVNWCPTCFQEMLAGTNYRAHVVGERVLATRIESDQLDYRYGRSTIVEAELPPDVAERCRRLTASLGLHFSGIDLMRTIEGAWYCFEVNPSPGFSYFEAGSGQPIAAALARFMLDAFC
jgi:glutathione synthase/RimK-type ligase-like ATP-grasp enzyme